MLAAVKEQWRRVAHHGAPTLVARLSDRVLITNERHSRLVRLDPDSGASLWEVTVEDPWGTVALGPQQCVYLCQHGTMRCIELADGSVRWTRSDCALSGFVTISGDAVVHGSWRGYRPVQGLSLDDGGTLWEDPPVEASSAGLRPLAVGASFLSGSLDDPTVRLRDSGAGHIVTTWTLPAPVATYPDAESAFTVASDGRVVLRSGSRDVFALGLDDGALQHLWRHPSDLPGRLTPVLRGNRLWLEEPTGVAVVDLAAGQLAGAFSPPSGVARCFTSFDGGLAVGDQDGLVHVLDDDAVVIARAAVTRPVTTISQAAPDLLHLTDKSSVVALAVRDGRDPPPQGRSRSADPV